MAVDLGLMAGFYWPTLALLAGLFQTLTNYSEVAQGGVVEADLDPVVEEEGGDDTDTTDTDEGEDDEAELPEELGADQAKAKVGQVEAGAVEEAPPPSCTKHSCSSLIDKCHQNYQIAP